ncbi:MAG: GDP-mannose 4,6-dehydratase [Actinomycetota bacterium]|nr:GDP-mannose 4,6-dehydratase [Actinomycetota bacterium]
MRDYLYVADLVEALELAAGKETRDKILNVGSGRGVSLNGLIACMAEVVGERPPVEYLPPRSLDVPTNVLNIGRAREELGWEPRVELTEGITRTWDWIRSLPESTTGKMVWKYW